MPSPLKRLSLVLADDHTFVTEALASMIRDEFELVGTARDGRQLLEIAKRAKPDVIVTDISMPQLNGLDASRLLRKENVQAKIIFLTMHADAQLAEEAFRAGASGYILKTCGVAEIVTAIRQVAQGRVYVTPLIAGSFISTLMDEGRPPEGGRKALTVRQREVLQLLAEGKTMKEVASVLGISTRTAESHKYEIMRQLGIDTTAQLVQYAVRIKLV
jgi:DNA-binding NarL/FixJ family response regulator